MILFAGYRAYEGIIPVAVAAAMNNKRVLMSRLRQEDYADSAFLGDSESVRKEVGLDHLLRERHLGNLKESIVADGTFSFLEHKLSFLSGPKKPLDRYVYNDIRAITSQLDSLYDLTMYDIGTASDNAELLKRCLEDADVIVLCPSQNRWEILELLQKYREYRKKWILALMEYDDTSYYNIRNLRRLYPELRGVTIIGLPKEQTFLDALSNTTVVEYFLKYAHEKGESENWLLYEARRLYAAIQEEGNKNGLSD